MTGNPSGISATALGKALSDTLPQAIADAFASVLQQVPVRALTQQHLCAQCVLTRMTWGASHEADVRAATVRAAQAAGISEADAVSAQLDPSPFLPEDLRKTMPPLRPAVTTVQGTEVCADHVPGRPGGKPLLVASGSLSMSALAGMRG